MYNARADLKSNTHTDNGAVQGAPQVPAPFFPSVCGRVLALMYSF